VADSTREAVLSAAVQVGYIAPSEEGLLTSLGIIKRGYREGSTHYDPFYMSIISAIEQECQRRDIKVLYTTAETDALHRMRELPSLLVYPQTPAFLLVGIRLVQKDVDYLLEQKRPVILIDSYAPTTIFDSVLTDNTDGAEQAVNYLIRAGHRHIGFVGGDDDEYPSIVERYDGYLHGLKRNRILDYYNAPCLYSNEEAYQATIDLLARAPEITALCIRNDRTAMVVYRALNDLGLSVPNDISVIGFDDWEPAKDMIPALTTVHVDTERMGILAVERMIHRFNHPEEPITKIVLGTYIVERASVRSLGI